MTILGTRPEIIRLSLIIQKLDQFAQQHVLVHTGQNYTTSLSDVFFDQLRIRKPDYTFASGFHSIGKQLGHMFAEVETAISKEKPDRILVLGDTNSALCSLIAIRMGIPVYHMEAGNRCYDLQVPEEINRKVIDSISTFNLPYTNISKDNLIREGIPPNRIWVSGNPIFEVIQHYENDIKGSTILQQLGLMSREFILVTVHRAENVDYKSRLINIFEGLHRVAEIFNLPIICSIHPRTQHRFTTYGIPIQNTRIQFSDPFGFFDFIKLQQHARCVITDSGTVQEESCIFGTPAVTIRTTTERPETVICGSNIISGLDPDRIAECVGLSMQNKHWECPDGYKDPIVSSKVVNFLMGGLHHVP